MNKKKDIIALALSVSFVMGGASISHADEINTDTTSYISEKQPSESENKSSNQIEDKENEDVTEVVNNSSTNEIQNLELSEEKTPEAQKTQKEATEQNYAEDEKKIKDYSVEERYRSTQMEQGDGTDAKYVPPDEKGNFIDGYRYHSSEPSATSEDKTQWGVEIEIDKEKGQRTYTDFYFTNTGNMGGVLDTGNVSANEAGKKIAGGEKDPNYKATSEIEISGSRNQRNLNLYASEEDLKHINNKDNTNTTMAWQGKYKKDHYVEPNATEGESAAFGFTVNPWPNENDSLELMKLNGEYNEKVFVQGQEFDTGIKIDNIDENAKERLVGQVYHPTTGEIVPGASAYIGENGTIHIKMPKGALKKDSTGVKYVVDDESIFSTDAYKGLQNLDVKFFARPRTADEFKAIVEANGGYGYYTETGAGTETINHDGKDVVIDKQGIDRYDHYNLIGGFKLNLDDTRYYTQKFVDGNNEETDDHKFSKVLPGDDFEVKINNPSADELDKTRKTDGEMDAAYKDGQASGKLNDEFLEVANRQIAENLGVDYDEFISNDDYKESRWSISGESDNISHFKIHAPKNAKAGDFLALPVEYTYTNGSTDTHWFHFVVQETNNNRPEYLAEVGPQGNVLVNNPIIPHKEQDLKKNQPKSYELIGNTFKDNKGNVWNVSINQETGAVTATLPINLPNGKEINGGEKLTVPVKVKYTDQTTKEERTEEIKAQFIATKQFKTQTSEKLTSEIPFETKVEYDPNLPEGYFQEFQKGQNGELTTTFIQDTLNGKKGLFQTDGTFIEGDRKIEATVTREATPRIIKIGTMPSSTTIEIPFDTEYEVDDTLAVGETKIVNEGEKGEVTITTSREKDGTVKINKETTKEAKNKKIKIGTMTKGEIVDTDKIPFGYKVEFDPDFYTNYPDATENYKIVTPGQEGENTKTWTIVNSQKVGDPKIDITEPVDAVIKVGQKDYNGTVTNTVTKEIPYTVTVVKNPDLEAGKSNVKQKGVAGSKTFEYSGEIFNGDLKEGSTFTEKELTDKYVAPKEEIIEIGTKPADNSKTIDSDVEVDVDIIYDPTIDKGVVNIGDLTPGKVTTVVKNVYDPETGEIKTTEETVVTNPSRKVVIGTKDFTSSYTEVDNKVTPYKTEIQFDDTMKEGEQETVQTGVDGVVTTETEVTIVNGVPTKGKPKITKSQEVQNQIIKVGTMTEGKHLHEEKIPFKYEIEYDSNLKAGEYVVDVEGKEGSRTTEWTIKNSEVVKDSASVTKEEAPTNAKIRVGNKDFVGNISHEVTEALPYDVKIVEDPNMIAGTSEIVTQGVAGSKTTKYTQAIKNGEKDGNLQSEVTAETKPTQQVIKVGTKPAENNKDYSKEVGVKVEYVYDSSLKMGVFKDGGLTNGKIETKIVNKYDPATGEITTTEEEIVTEAIQKIIVGTQDFTGKYPYESTTEIPFKVVVKKDPNLAKGQSRVEQEGKAGSKTTYYEIAIKNGEKVGDPIITKEVENDQPLDHIIYVGTAVAKSTTVETVEKDIPYETKINYDENLDAGSQVVDEEGVIGKEKVTITTDITDGTGETSKTTETFKDKVDREVRIGTKPVTKVVEKPFNTEYQYDENLEAGKTEEVTPGKNGKVTITTTYDKDQKKVVTSETEEAGQNRVVKIGGKTNGTEIVKEEIPFEVEVRKDPSLKKGEWKYATDDEGNELKGEKGEQEKTLTIENSKVINTSEPTVTKQPKKAVILVGEGVNEGTHTITEEVDVPFETKIEFDNSLKPGEQKVTQEGEPGKKSRDITLKIQDGKVTNTEEGEFTQTKAPKDKIIKVGRNTEGKVEYKEEIPFGYKVEEVEDLKKGEYRIVKPGKVGTKTTTWTIENSKVVSESTEEIVPAEDALIQVGKGTNDGTHEIVEKKELPFETRYEYDDSLEPGEEKVVTPGFPGEQERTNTIVIKDGKVVEVKEGEFKTTKEPQERLIMIGRKSTEGETTKTIKREIPYETKVIYDETLESGTQKIENEGKAGKEEVTITQKVKDSKTVGDPTETTKTITEKEDRVVRVGIKPVVKEVELGNDTEYRHNPELKEGETKVIEEGSKGYVKYTTTFNKETGKLEVIEERVEPTNKIVEYGSKTDGEFTYESEQAYDIIIRENPDLEAGKTNVIQEGIVGKTETTVKIENSKEVSRDTKTITEKQDKIIEIGTKNVCEIPPVDPEDPDQPGGEDPKDPEDPGEDDPKDPEEPGEEDPKDPEDPGEDDPKDPEEPGEEEPKDPEEPGEDDPKDPEKPGEDDPKDPGKPGEENPKDPGKLGEKDPTKSGQTSETPQKPKDKKDKKINPSRKLEKTKIVSNKENANKNPSTGVSSLSIVLSNLGISLGALGFSKKKRKNK